MQSIRWGQVVRIVALCILLVGMQETRATFERVYSFLAAQSGEQPFVHEVHVRACLEPRVNVEVDLEAVKSTLRAIQGSKVPHLGEESVIPLMGILYSYQFSIKLQGSCDTDTNVRLILHASSSTSSNSDGAFTVRDGVVEAMLRVPDIGLSQSELVGRVSGSIIAAANSWMGSDLSRGLFFSAFEDDGIEVSVIGLVSESEHKDPLSGLDLVSLRQNLRTWLGTEENDTIVKATTRNLSDHPGLLAAIISARERSTTASDATTLERSGSQNRGGFNADEFLHIASESSDALLRGGTAAKLLRLRRREVEVYVFTGAGPGETFENERRFHVYRDDMAVIIPPGEHTDPNLDVTRLVTLGLAQIVAAVPLRATTVKVSNSDEWLNRKAIANVVLYELHRTLKAAREALKVQQTLNKVDLKSFVVQLEAVSKMITDGLWTNARSLLRGSLRDDLRQIVKVSRQEKKRCCTRTLVEGDVSGMIKRKAIFIYLYGFVTVAVVVGVCVFLILRSRSKAVNVKFLFGRTHLD